jgi:hypothetical protein
MSTRVISNQIPLAVHFAVPITQFSEIEGSYDPLSQKWSTSDTTMASTWSRSTTTGTRPLQFSDPDEDKDD